ncbi:programmed cell death 1 ligand 1-like [Mobula birostris]|uniref:programmed cell death 1 ligand 1-like n=1 Tax=Mobula birostris TaxID=1983395 RepID=UPI003B281D16
MVSRGVIAALSLLLISGCSYCEGIYCKFISDQLSVKSSADVVLPCAFNSSGHSAITLVWQIGTNRSVLRASETKEAKILDESFRGRASVPREWYQSGNASLQISRLQATDAGTYNCIIRGEGLAEYCTKLKMEVISAGHSQSYGLSSVWMSVLLLAWSRFSF